MRYFLPLSVLLLTLPGRALAAEDAVDGVQLAGKVHEIFEAKCLDCHGPELPRPKGKFGYVLDLKRVAENPDYIERGHPEKSELYKMVFNDEMPGEDANVPPLTKEEKVVVKQWIEAGAPDAPQLAGEHAAVPANGAEGKVQMPVWKKA